MLCAVHKFNGIQFAYVGDKILQRFHCARHMCSLFDRTAHYPQESSLWVLGTCSLWICECCLLGILQVLKDLTHHGFQSEHPIFHLCHVLLHFGHLRPAAHLVLEGTPGYWNLVAGFQSGHALFGEFRRFWRRVFCDWLAQIHLISISRRRRR